MSQWISVKDRLPEEDSLILAYMEGFGGVKRVNVIRFDPLDAAAGSAGGGVQ